MRVSHEILKRRQEEAKTNHTQNQAEERNERIFLKNPADIERVFLRTLKTFSELERVSLLKDFQSDMHEGVGLHFFPMFLRQKNMSPLAFELAQIEWIIFQFEQSPHEKSSAQRITKENKTESEVRAIYRLNPLAHCLFLHFPVEEFSLVPGLWGFKASHNERGFDSYLLKPLHASLLDVISEGVVINEQALLELSLEPEKARSYQLEDARKSLVELLDWGLIQK